MFCDSEVFEYEGRDAFYSTPVHWGCAKMAAQIRQSLTVEAAEDPLDKVPQAEQEAYLQALQGFESPTLGTLVLEYEEHPEERTPDMEWKILLVRRVLRSRTGISL